MQMDGDGLDFEEKDPKKELEAKKDEPQESKAKKEAADNDGVPYCVDHHCRMKVSSSAKSTRYFKCPVPKCENRGKALKLRVETVVPATPTHCPRCSTKKKKVFMVRCDRVSDSIRVTLRCPECQEAGSAQAVPQLASEAAWRRAGSPKSSSPDLGDR